MSDAPAPSPRYLISLSCADRIGVVADVSRFLVEHRCNIVESAQHRDAESDRFFLRTEFDALSGEPLEALRAAFAPVAEAYAMRAQFFDLSRKTATVVMVSKLGHCLNDLLFRWRIGALPVDIRAVVSNHPDFQDLVEQAGLPFLHLPVTPQTREEKAGALMQALDGYGAELVVLARYMQILPPSVCDRYAGRIINIHHSFLPSFKGARPYHAAYERGVKLIGATAHYVTADLDEGPIIEQEVQRVHYNMSATDYVAVGRDVEALVLARAVKWHAEHRVLMNGARTVVL